MNRKIIILVLSINIIEFGTNVIQLVRKEEVSMKGCKKKILFYAFIFLILVWFFSVIVPMIPCTFDDWLYVSYSRKAVPIWGAWNPSRVFPEIFMPFVASVGVTFLMPLFNNYIGVLTLSYAIAASAVITIYVWSFAGYFKKKFELSELYTTSIAILFLLFHFIIFFTTDDNNVFLFWSDSVTNLCYYTIPILLNITLILVLETHESLQDLSYSYVGKEGDKRLLKKGLIVLWAYLMVFSNLYCSYIIALWSGMHLMIALLTKKSSIKQLLKHNILHVGIIGLWLISLIFELSGGRAADFKGKSFLHNIAISLKTLFSIKYNSYFLWLFLICIIISIFLVIKDRDKAKSKSILYHGLYLGVFAICSIIFLVLLSARTSPTSTKRPEVLVGLMPCFIAILCLLIVYILKKAVRFILIIPFISLVLLFEMDCYGRAFKLPSCGMTSIAGYYIDLDIIQKATDATQNDLEEVTVYIPYFGGNGWPLPASEEMGRRISHTLYKHRIIPYEIQINLIADPTLNQKYHIK